jgi:biopolymer transport protein ExbB/TolQ
MSLSEIYTLVGNLTYVALAAVGLYGMYCVMIVWRRIAHTRFKTEEDQAEFLDELEKPLRARNFEAAAELCEGDTRAMPQLALLAIINRDLGYTKLRQLVAERFQRDVLSDLEYRISWVNTMIKSAPMLGLYGTVLGMMGAFGNLAGGGPEGGKVVDAEALAENISLALITTAVGLTIAIPLIVATASISVRMRKMEDLVASGVNRFMDSLKGVIGTEPTDTLRETVAAGS